jgi:hypothetical protein
MMPVHARISGWAFAIACAFSLSPGSSAGVMISEFMASNDRTLKDDFQQDADWIELVNPGAEPVDLAGWRLTDRAQQPSMWVFPSVVLPPGGHLLVYATGRNRRLPDAPLHTNFSLAAGGEYLGLIRPDGTAATEFAPAYPPQVTDVSYGYPRESLQTALPAGSPGQVGVPVSLSDFQTHFADWRTSLAERSGTSWQSCRSGIGFDDPEAAYGAWIHPEGEISARLRNQTRSACLRLPFAITDPADVQSLRLRMRWDDGFIAWINGVEIARNAAPATPAWNSLATSNRNEALNESWTDFIVPGSSLPLQAGTNLLAIQGFNVTTGSSDFLILPVLDVTYTADSVEPGYFTSPTPGQPNGPGGLIGPVLDEATRLVARPPADGSGAPVPVTVRVRRSVFDVQAGSVRMYWRVMFGAENAVSLRDDGISPDAQAGDGVFSGFLPTAGLSAGQMLRWRFEAADTQGRLGLAPLYADPEDSDRYYGTVAADASTHSSQLPVIHQFVENPSAAATRAGSRCSLFYLDRFYDNVGINLHGQSTSNFNKKSHNFDFNGDNRFVWSADPAARPVKDVDILSNHADKTRTRNSLSHEVARRAGAVYHFAFPVRVQRNAAFHGVFDMVEDGDERMIERNGLDPAGALYKIYNNLSSTSGAQKKSRRHEDMADLQALISGLDPGLSLAVRRTFAYDQLDLPATINYLAVRQLINDRDHGHKNYYVYRDSDRSREWRPVIWDVDLSWGHSWNASSGYFDDALYSNPLTPGQSQNNRLYQIIWETPEFRQMFLRRFRSLMEEILQPPGTNGGHIETFMRETAARIDPDPANPSAWTDGDLDFTRWGTWGRGLRPREETEFVISTFLGPHRSHFFDTNAASRQRYNGDALPDAGQTTVPDMVRIEEIDFLPASGRQEEEYILLRNTSAQAVDLSGWRLEGAVSHVFAGGTVIPAGPGTATSEYRGLLICAKDAHAFRQRATGPRGGQKRLVQGGYQGQLSARGESISLRDASGLLVSSFAYAGQATAHQRFLRITEIQYHPAEPTIAERAAFPGIVKDDFEYLELLNSGPEPLPLLGARFTSGITYVFPDVTLAPGARIILAKHPAAFSFRYPGNAVPVLGPYDGQLDNAGEPLEIADPVGEIILDFEYKDGWYPATDGSGRSLVLRDPALTPHDRFGSALEWAISAGPLGNPGEAKTRFASAYQGWDRRHFTGSERDNPALSGPFADPDGDGRPNWLEYALATDPRRPDQPSIQALRDESTAGIRFQRPDLPIDLHYELQTAPRPDAAAWQSIPLAELQQQALPLDPETSETTLLEESTQETRFYRLRILRQP